MSKLPRQKTNIHWTRANQPPVSDGRWIGLFHLCHSVKLVQRVVINFYSASGVLVCFRKAKTACVHGTTRSRHPSAALLQFRSALFNITHPSLSRLPSNPHSWVVVVSVTPSATCEGSLAQPSLNKWNQSQKQLAPGEGGGIWEYTGRFRQKILMGMLLWCESECAYDCLCVYPCIYARMRTRVAAWRWKAAYGL